MDGEQYILERLGFISRLVDEAQAKSRFLAVDKRAKKLHAGEPCFYVSAKGLIIGPVTWSEANDKTFERRFATKAEAEAYVAYLQKIYNLAGLSGRGDWVIDSDGVKHINDISDVSSHTLTYPSREAAEAAWRLLIELNNLE